MGPTVHRTMSSTADISTLLVSAAYDANMPITLEQDMDVKLNGFRFRVTVINIEF